ncbi:glycerophosphodiester phosphodiesterase family protein [Paenibacillus prosopidis]|uniref:Glycerophosphoryl diester phosphodiesterase n=1 Tax=Paenibacillus prosopidis TaxID=630520 RepID=A0A368W4T7_9BACL|nr:glycerophosphodiester phosphodiesterase family protein [Paenibacillus prosopidis]RCW49161.1 glycerophosphoryl diester phosphodiesterase [Paenibacillus prosopidis]
MKINNPNRFNQIYSEFNDPNGRIMVVAHRGDWLYAPENTLPAISNAIALGVDMIEIDVQRTRDGKLILMHDETVNRMTSGSGAIADLSYEKLLSFQVKRAQGGETAGFTREQIPTLEEVMKLVKGKVFVNLDKCWDIREQVYQVLLETGTVDHGLFKSDADPDEVAAFLESKPIRPEYMQIIHAGNAHLLHDPNALLAKIKPKAVEFIFEDEASPFSIEEAFRMFAGTCRVWMNTMWDSLCAGHSDVKSLKNDADGWGWGIARKVNMIQTDYSRQLLNYLQK